MLVGEELTFALEPTLQPRWAPWSSAAWRAQVGMVLRLQLEARREGHELWTLTCEVDLASESPTVEVP